MAADRAVLPARAAVLAALVVKQRVGPVGRVDLPGELMPVVYPAFGPGLLVGPWVRTATGEERVGAVVLVATPVILRPRPHVLR